VVDRRGEVERGRIAEATVGEVIAAVSVGAHRVERAGSVGSDSMYRDPYAGHGCLASDDRAHHAPLDERGTWRGGERRRGGARGGGRVALRAEGRGREHGR